METDYHLIEEKVKDMPLCSKKNFNEIYDLERCFLTFLG